MKDVRAQAVALQQLLSEGGSELTHPSVVDSVISCCDGLCAAGESSRGCALIETYQRTHPLLATEASLRLTVSYAHALYATSRIEEARQLVRSTIRDHETGRMAGLPELHGLRIVEAACHWADNRIDDGIDKLLAIRRELLTKPDSSLLASCTAQLQAAYMVKGEHRLARAFGLEAIVSARRCGDRATEAVALANHGRLERYLCKWTSSIEFITEAVSIFEELSNKEKVASGKRNLGLTFWKIGRLKEAARLAEESHDGSAEIENELYLDFADLLLAMVQLHVGTFAHESAPEALTAVLAGNRPESRVQLLGLEFAGDVHLEKGEATEALQAYDEVWPKALALVPRGDICAELRRRRAECYLLLGRHQEARDEAEAGLLHCRDLGDRYEEAATYRVLALSAAALGHPDEARHWFEEGFACYDSIETPYEWGKLWLAYGDWLLGPHAGAFADRRGAIEAYYAAHDRFERMGAAAKLAEADARLKGLLGPQLSPAGADGHSLAKDAVPRRIPRLPQGLAKLETLTALAREAFGMVTRNHVVLGLLQDVEKLARSTSPILVLGESGTGKELIARGIHKLSGRKGNYMAINMGSLPREIIESELFGHVAGSFTGATRDKPGMFEVCDHGTVFLDEIAEMPVELQSRLLRFLETGESRRVGSNHTVAVDTRIIAATNRERSALERGKDFRVDLYYRLAHAVVVLPPLRRRGDDVELLIRHFLTEACRAEHKQVTLSPEALRVLTAYSWPGNVRQLRAVVKRLVILAAEGHQVEAGELELEGEAERPDEAGLNELTLAERRRIMDAMTEARGSRAEAARALGIPRTTLFQKMKRLGLIQPADGRAPARRGQSRVTSD